MQKRRATLLGKGALVYTGLEAVQVERNMSLGIEPPAMASALRALEAQL